MGLDASFQTSSYSNACAVKEQYEQLSRNRTQQRLLNSNNRRQNQQLKGGSKRQQELQKGSIKGHKKVDNKQQQEPVAEGRSIR